MFCKTWPNRYSRIDFFVPLSSRRLLFGPVGGCSFIIGGPCLSHSTRLRTGSASWSALSKLASVQSEVTEQGVHLHSVSRSTRPLLGPFTETTKGVPFGTRQTISAADGPKPGVRNNGLRAPNVVLRKLVEGRCLKSTPLEGKKSPQSPEIVIESDFF